MRRERDGEFRDIASRRRFIAGLCATVAAATASRRVFGQATETAVQETKSRWKFGFELVGQGGAIRGIQVSFPTPMDWPDQTVELVEDDKPKSVRIREDVLSGGVRQVTASIPTLGPRETLRFVRTYDVTRKIVRYDRAGDRWFLPTGGKLDEYLGESPMIETRDKAIRKAADDLTDLSLSTWQQVERSYDWVRETVEYKFDPDLKGAKQALDRGVGDCEELTSLFVAICRNQGVPARSVWVPGHCYPEFYLEDAGGEGRWISCQAAGERQFGWVDERRPILQKGDSFTPPGSKTPIRYVAGSISATDAPIPPKITFLMETAS